LHTVQQAAAVDKALMAEQIEICIPTRCPLFVQ